MESNTIQTQLMYLNSCSRKNLLLYSLAHEPEHVSLSLFFFLGGGGGGGWGWFKARARKRLPVYLWRTSQRSKSNEFKARIEIDNIICF